MKCQTCGKTRAEHGPKLQCPCTVWTEQGSFIQWNKCTFKSLEVVKEEHADLLDRTLSEIFDETRCPKLADSLRCWKQNGHSGECIFYQRERKTHD
jgi:hypothetical protein